MFSGGRPPSGGLKSVNCRLQGLLLRFPKRCRSFFKKIYQSFLERAGLTAIWMFAQRQIEFAAAD